MTAHAKHQEADIVITLMDAWVCEPEQYGHDIAFCPWYPVDSEPLPRRIYDKVIQSFQPLVFSRFGERVSQEAGLDVRFVPHGVDTSVLSPMDREEAREMLEFPKDRFIVGMVAANKGNPSRKALTEQMLAFRMFKDQHPDALLYLHMTTGQRGELGGENLVNYANSLGLALGEDVIFADQYTLLLGFGDEYMRCVYNAIDVLLSVSKGEGFCYTPGARVMTETGMKPIEALTTQDRVVTHVGHLRDVEQTMKRIVVDEPVVTIRALGNNQTQTVTTNHPIYGLRRKWKSFTSVRRALKRGDAQLDWIPAGELQVGDFMFVPRREMSPLSYDTVDLGQFIPTDGDNLTSRYRNRGRNAVTARMVAEAAGVSTHTAQRVLGNYELERVGPGTQTMVLDVAADLGWQPLPHVSRHMPLTEDTGYLFGQYLAEGSLGTNGQIEFASHTKQTDVRERLARIVQETWGLTGRELIRGNGARFIFTCKPLADMLRATCGAGARQKHLPSFVFDNLDFARGVLIGAWIGDGSFNPTPTYTTVSEQLAYGIRQLASSLGFHATIQYTSDDDWHLGIAGTQAETFYALFGMSDRPKIKRQRVLPVNGGWLVPIQSIERSRYTGFVYNIEVHEDHSYCVEGLATHNCIPLIEAQACGCPVIVGDWTAMGELCLSGWKVPKEHATPWWTPLETYQYIPRPSAIATCLEQAYAHWGDEGFRTRARERAMAYDADHVTRTFWVPVLAEVEQRLKGTTAPAEPVAVGDAS